MPGTYAVEALIGLSSGGPVASPLLGTVAWAAGLTLTFGTIAVRRYRHLA